MSDHVSDTACRIFVVVNPIAGGADVAKIRQILDRQLHKDGGTAEIYETLGTTPVTVDLLPAALQVIVPKDP